LITTRTHAFITPSYAGDFERFRLLAESLDEMATGNWCHYVLTADHDYALFKPFEGPRRKVIPDSALLPTWLRSSRKPFDRSNRRIWFSTHPLHLVWPMSGWHVQQLRKMLIARHVEEPVLVFADSDSIMIRRFGHERLLKNGLLRLYANPSGIVRGGKNTLHLQWVRQSADVLGIEPEALPATNYIANLVTWRRDHALSMLEHIEKKHGRDIVSAMGRYKTFSEYQIYGSFVERILKPKDQPADSFELTLTHWGLDHSENWSMDAFMATLSPDQVAIAIQSFIKIPITVLRETYRGMADKLR
jgi:Family of unknown function (DUF6492)